MLRLNGVFHIRNGVSWIISIIYTYIMLNIALFPLVHAEEALQIDYNISTKSHLDRCVYHVVASVWDNKTMKPIPNALVEFRIPIIGMTTNTTDQAGSTSVSLSLEKGQQSESCVEALIYYGYSIEATSKGYAGHGFGVVS
jgi:uncharacterized protein YukJ